MPQVLRVELPYRISSTCNTEHYVSKPNKLFVQTVAQPAQNGLSTGNALSVEIFFFLSFRGYNKRESTRSVLFSVISLFNKEVKTPYNKWTVNQKTN
jgi:hypothetical protein